MADYDGARTQDAPEEHRLMYCAQPARIPPVLPPGLNAGQVRAIIIGQNKWLNHTVLHYYFFGNGDGSPAAWAVPEDQRAAVRKAFDSWKGLGLGLEFAEVTAAAEAEVRIGFDQGDGSWSYVGKDILAQPQTDRTMNFGWDLTTDYGTTTALHEIGHTLGMPHEHQNPNAGIVWDEEAVYAFLGGPPNNWPRETTFNNVLRKLDPHEVAGSDWDWKSVMEYDFPGGLIVTPAAFATGVHPPGGLSDLDRQYMLSWYPGNGDAHPKLEPFVSTPMTLAPGAQADYAVEPPGTRSYTIATFGESDAMLGLFEVIDGSPRFVAGDDDSGEDRNAQISMRLFQGRHYVVRVRCYYSAKSATTAVMYW
jgi:Astacin (Peptidase family M12A)